MGGVWRVVSYPRMIWRVLFTELSFFFSFSLYIFTDSRYHRRTILCGIDNKLVIVIIVMIIFIIVIIIKQLSLTSWSTFVFVSF